MSAEVKKHLDDQMPYLIFMVETNRFKIIRHFIAQA
jgi:hypothetical protein